MTLSYEVLFSRPPMPWDSAEKLLRGVCQNHILQTLQAPESKELQSRDKRPTSHSGQIKMNYKGTAVRQCKAQSGC